MFQTPHHVMQRLLPTVLAPTTLGATTLGATILATFPATFLTALLAAALGGLMAPGAAAAQDVPEWLFPERDLLPDLLAGPRDPVAKGQLVYAHPNPTAFGPGPSGEVTIAATVPVVRVPGSRPGNSLVVGLEGAAFAHFSFAVVTRELVNTDWVFAVPIVWDRGSHWIRLRYYHTSSHLGDEYQRRFGPSSVNFSRDGGDLTLYLRPAVLELNATGRHGSELNATGLDGGGLGIYAVAFWSLNSHPEERPVWRARAGFEADPWHGALFRPYLAVDAELEENSAHGPRWTGQLGLWLPRAQGRPLRVALEAIAGPSAMGQFTTDRTRRLGLGLYWNP